MELDATGPMTVLVGVTELEAIDVWEADVLGPVVPVDALPATADRSGIGAACVDGPSAASRLCLDFSLASASF